MDPILEGLVTTLEPDGSPHLAPMGPRVGAGGALLFRPYPGSRTLRNLKAHGEGVLHVSDDVLLLARAALGEADVPACRSAEVVRGHVMVDCCRWMEFRVESIDESREPVHVSARVVHNGRGRDFWGFNRGKHAVLEAAILITRLHLLSREHVETEFARLRVLIDKTGGPAEHEAFRYLSGKLGGQR